MALESKIDGRPRRLRLAGKHAEGHAEGQSHSHYLLLLRLSPRTILSPLLKSVLWTLQLDLLENERRSQRTVTRACP